MAYKWNSSQYTGIRYREHPNRKHNGKPDRYFAIRYKINGKLKEEALGWASEGWNAQKASLERSNLRKAQKTGEGPETLTEKRQLTKERKEDELAKKKQREKDLLTFKSYFEKTYLPQAKIDKVEKSWKREQSLFKLWVNPVIGDKPLKDIVPFHIEKIKKDMIDKGRAPRSVNYAIALIRQVFNSAKFNGKFQGESPIIGVKKLKFDNKRVRFLTHTEADTLMEKLKTKDESLYAMAMISLHCGLRGKEIFSLTTNDINHIDGTILVRDPKNTKNRYVFMTEEIKQICLKFNDKDGEALIFPKRNGEKRKETPKLFRKIISDLGFNSGITDRRKKVVFHTLRHTFASWLVQNGVDLYTVQKLMGHSTIAMTERYAHLAQDNLKSAVKKLEESMKRQKSAEVVDIRKK